MFQYAFIYIYYVFLFAVFESTIYTSFFKDYNTICIMNFLLFKCFTYMNYILEIMYIYIYKFIYDTIHLFT